MSSDRISPLGVVLLLLEILISVCGVICWIFICDARKAKRKEQTKLYWANIVAAIAVACAAIYAIVIRLGVR